MASSLPSLYCSPIESTRLNTQRVTVRQGSILSTSRMFSLCFAHLLNAQATTKSSESVSILALFSLDFSASSLYASQSSSRGILCSQQLALSQATQRGDAFSAPPPQVPQDAHSLGNCNQVLSIQIHLLTASLCCPLFCGSPLKTWTKPP